ncbi:TPA: CpXC domain-containing protein [Streptococcus suis]
MLDWDFFKFTCHNCNHKVLIDYPTVVLDEEQKTIIHTQQKSKANQSSVFKPLSTNNWF